jgi:hypothetical protein
LKTFVFIVSVTLALYTKQMFPCVGDGSVDDGAYGDEEVDDSDFDDDCKCDDDEEATRTPAIPLSVSSCILPKFSETALAV